jgi:hypothetical protein
MKTPREILLARHQDANPNLDEVRRVALTKLTPHSTRETETLAQFLLKLWRELILPCRRTWAGLAAVWLVVIAFNLSHAGRSEVATTKSTIPPGEMRLVWQEQRSVLAEIIDQRLSLSPAEPPRRPNNQPRSEHRSVVIG